jgi:hypothetical protein
MPHAARRPLRRPVVALTAALALAAGLAGLQAGALATPHAEATVTAAPTTGQATTPAPAAVATAGPSPALPPALVAPARATTPPKTPRPAGAAAPAHPPRAVHAVHSCRQDVAPGYVACQAERRTDIPVQPQMSGAVSPRVAPDGYGPADLASAYALPSSTGGVGQTVYIVDAYDAPNAESDLGVYRSRFGLPACTTANGCFRKLNQQGSTSPLPSANTGWAEEISLDLDMVSAVCPNCHITLIEANSAANGNMFAAVARANQLGARFVSMSWGGNDQGHTASEDAVNFAATGVVYTAASGDKGYAAGPIYPATSPRVVAVGGTSLTRSGTARGWSEEAWSGAGSGCSAGLTAPAWQAGVTPCGTTKGTTDVSAVADPATGVAVFDDYQDPGWAVYGGTSAAAPIIAATYALAGTPDPSVNPAALLYRHAHSLNDVTSGSTGSCSMPSLCAAVAGWDGPTGLGTPEGLAAFRLGRGKHTTVPGQAHPSAQAVRGTLLQQSSTPSR